MERPEREEDQPSPASVEKRKDAAGLRVALFSGNYNCIRDGANNTLNHLGRFLLDRGAAVRAYSPTLPHPAFAPAGELVSIPSVPIPGRGEYRLALGLGRHAREDIQRFAPTVFHLSAPNFLGHQAQAFARHLGVPVVASLHTRFESYLDYYGLGFARALIERMEKRFYCGCDLVLAPNQAMAEMLARWGLGDKVRPWGRGVDHAQFAPEYRSLPWRRRHGYADDDMVLLFFGRLVREKGLDILAEAIDMLRARGHHIRPLVVGIGPEEEHFRRRLGDAVFTGHLEGPRLARAIASADIMLNPSVTETFGNVDLEAMASGLALISADVPYARTLLDPQTAMLVEPGNPAAYVAAVERLILHPEERAVLARAALHRSMAFSWSEILASVLSAYRELGALPSRRTATSPADSRGRPLDAHEEREFEGGEHKTRPLVEVAGRDVFVVQSLHAGAGQSCNDKLVQLLFFIGALKDAGAARVTAIAPYLAYSRKDRRTKPRDPVNTRYVAALFEAVRTDCLVTLEVHNASAFENAFGSCRPEHIPTARLLAQAIAGRIGDAPAAVVSPDAGGDKRAELFRHELEQRLGRPVAKGIMEKHRSMGVLSGALFAGDVAGRTAIIVDDLISSGSTILRAVRACRDGGATRVLAAATHGMFNGNFHPLFGDEGPDELIIADTVPLAPDFPEHYRSRLAIVDSSSLVADVIGRLHDGGAASDLLPYL